MQSYLVGEDGKRALHEARSAIRVAAGAASGYLSRPPVEGVASIASLAAGDSFEPCGKGRQAMVAGPALSCARVG